MRKVFILISILVFFIIPNKIFASQIDIEIYPSVYEIVTYSPSQVELSYKVVNHGDPAYFRLLPYLVKFADDNSDYELLDYPKGDPKFPEIYLETEKLSLNKTFLIEAKSTFTIPLSLSFSEETEERDFYISFILESAANENFTDENKLYTTAGVGSMLYITVKNQGTLDQNIENVLFDVKGKDIKIGKKKYKIFNSYSEIPVILKMKNSGENYTKVNGEINLYSKIKNNNKMYAISENTIPAKSEKILSTDMNESPLETVKMQSNFFNLYSLSADLSDSSGDEVRLPDINILILPISGSIALLSSFLFIALVYLVSKKIKKLDK